MIRNDPDKSEFTMMYVVQVRPLTGYGCAVWSGDDVSVLQILKDFVGLVLEPAVNCHFADESQTRCCKLVFRRTRFRRL